MSIAEEFTKRVNESNNQRMQTLIDEITKAGVSNQFNELMIIIQQPIAAYQARVAK